MTRSADFEQPDAEVVAGNGLLHRRLFLSGAGAALGAAGIGLLTAREAQAAPPPALADWMRAPGAGMSAYGNRSRFEQDVERLVGRRPAARPVPARRARR